MIGKKAFLEKYGDVKVKFNSYYKYTFTFSGTAPNGDHITVSVGGDDDTIYRMEVVADLEETITSLDPSSGEVYRTVGEAYDKFYDY